MRKGIRPPHSLAQINGARLELNSVNVNYSYMVFILNIVLGGPIRSPINMPSGHCKYESAGSQIIVNEGPERECFRTQLNVNGFISTHKLHFVTMLLNYTGTLLLKYTLVPCCSSTLIAYCSSTLW